MIELKLSEETFNIIILSMKKWKRETEEWQTEAWEKPSENLNEYYQALAQHKRFNAIINELEACKEVYLRSKEK
jgi:primosomal protein N''